MREGLLADRVFFERGNIGNNHNHFTRFLSFLRCFNFSSWVELDQTRFAHLLYPFSALFCQITSTIEYLKSSLGRLGRMRVTNTSLHYAGIAAS